MIDKDQYKNNVNIQSKQNVPMNYMKNIDNIMNNSNPDNTNQSYLFTNPSLFNMQINSSINLNVQPGARYFIIKSVDEDNIHKVTFKFFILKIIKFIECKIQNLV